jgi:hypothetical protein
MPFFVVSYIIGPVLIIHTLYASSLGLGSHDIEAINKSNTYWKQDIIFKYE